MVRTSYDLEYEFIRTLTQSTGFTLSEWLKLIRNSGLKTRIETIEWLKGHHKLGHVPACLLVGIYGNKGRPVYTKTNI